MGVDPLAGNGVARALRSASAAAVAIERSLDGAEELGPSELAQRFAEYLDRRAEIYRSEPRWPDAPFWARRRPGIWRDAPLTLDPSTVLRTAGSATPRMLAPAEALLPPRAITATLAALQAPQPAHVAMSRLRELAPLGDRRLLVGLQRLLEHDVLRRE
jgi:hypothetical protein